MFGLFKKAGLRESAKLLYQNFAASAYIGAFQPELAQTAERQVEAIRTIWEPLKSLPPDVLRSLLETNRALRKVYERTPGHHLKSFDDEFKPLLGWTEYLKKIGL